MSKTTEDLQAAFAGESQANRKYLAYAKQADAEGFPQIAKLFRAVAEAETIHAHSHLKVLGEIHDTLENLQAAMGGENYEHVEMYPEFINNATEEGNKKAANSFRWAMEVEKVHEVLFQKAMEVMGKDMPDVDYYICPFCGYTHAGKFEGKCPVCGTPAEKFFRVD